MTLPVFIAPDADTLRACACGDSYVLDGDEGFHAATVRRIDVGAMLDVVDGTGLRARCTVIDRAKKALTLRIDHLEHEDEPGVELLLIQALSTGGRDEMAIEMATEVGVDAVMPWQANRSEVRWKGEKAAKGIRKWESTLRSATKQSRRAFIPRLEETRSSAALAQWITQTTQDGAWVLVCHESADQRLSELLTQLRGLSSHASSASAALSAETQPSCPPKIAVIVGPEGGVDPDELSLFEAAGAKFCLLGNTVLRASSAGPVALSLISDAIGRW